ncbi:hypothetical protein AVEN_140378-1 [Araneus ventricosus]|uniref:Uncharacterized protein n=1 Tax=Araneus ventricosus TaxID=182803 RepID=A0A4Y2N9G6_ARAVE|nr:hypothetical protein AVEN_140378-1 [Araneus ventricosus]
MDYNRDGGSLLVGRQASTSIDLRVLQWRPEDDVFGNKRFVPGDLCELMRLKGGEGRSSLCDYFRRLVPAALAIPLFRDFIIFTRCESHLSFTLDESGVCVIANLLLARECAPVVAFRWRGILAVRFETAVKQKREEVLNDGFGGENIH